MLNKINGLLWFLGFPYTVIVMLTYWVVITASKFNTEVNLPSSAMDTAVFIALPLSTIGYLILLYITSPKIYYYFVSYIDINDNKLKNITISSSDRIEERNFKNGYNLLLSDSKIIVIKYLGKERLTTSGSFQRYEEFEKWLYNLFK